MPSATAFLPTLNGYGQGSAKLQVNIKRLTMVPIHEVPWVSAAPLGPLDYDDDDDNRLRPDHDEYDEMLAIKTLERVKAEDEDAFKDVNCAICREDLQVVVTDEKKVKESPMKLPCMQTRLP